MESAVGRWLEGHIFPTQRLLRTLIDLGSGAAPSARAELEGRELVFRCSDRGRGFLRVIPQVSGALLAFPRGGELFDPKGQLRGPAGLQRMVAVKDQSDLDPYLRRLIDEAARLDR